MSPLISRVAALALTIAVFAGVAFGLALPAASRYQTLSDEIAGLEAQLAKLRGQESAVVAPPRLEVADPALIEAPTEPLAAAWLQDALSQAAATAGGRVRSLRIEEATPLEAARKLAVTVELTADMSSFAALLHRIETGSPYLFVERLEARRVSGGEDDAPADVALRLRVFGLARESAEP